MPASCSWTEEVVTRPKVEKTEGGDPPGPGRGTTRSPPATGAVFEGDESESSDCECDLIDWKKIDRQYKEKRLVTLGLRYQDFLKTVPELGKLKQCEICDFRF